MKTDILREKFLSFFKDKNHKIIPSAALVPESDPTLLFTSAGMNQFKEQFRGNIGDFSRATTCQKCLRTDDLEKVGKTPAHHTFFEMLGNFSFGDYFKKEAISWAWEFLRCELNLAEDRLWISVYEKDEESYDIWRSAINVPAQKIIKLGEVENFWPSDAIRKGPNGPCGPCSEIFYDEGRGVGCGKENCSPACDCGRFVEIWNLVFTQFERKETGVLESLPNKNIDTGMGLERMAAVMQGVSTNFEIDILKPIVDFICRQTGTDYGKELNKRSDIYCICDHIRAVVFAVCENVLPSNEERGYVIRKLIRKSSMHAYKLLKKQEPFLYKLVPVVSKVMHGWYPEVKSRQQSISQIIQAEEVRFQEVLRKAEVLVESKFSNQKARNTGEVAFELYDTFGMPLEVTKDLAKELFNVEIDEKSFNEHMSRQKNLSKAGSQMKGEVFAGGVASFLRGLEKTEFLGYEKLTSQAKVILIADDNHKKGMALKGQKLSIVLDKSCFYGERGGQAADKGIIEGKGFLFRVENVSIYNDFILHEGCVEKGKIAIGAQVTAKVDAKRRMATARHHTATHLLQSALRKVLGEHIGQAGSFVDENRLRFDFTHFKAVEEEELQKVENLVNEYIKKNFRVEIKILDKEQALQLGAIALFGEKYEEKVRVIIIDDVSKELCGGTHLNFTGEAQVFKITKESAISAGVRRIEAVCGELAYEMINEEGKILEDISENLGVGVGSVAERMGEISKKLKKFEKELKRLRDKNANSAIEGLVRGAEKGNDTSLIIETFSGLSAPSLRVISDSLNKKLDSYVAVLFSKTEDKVNLIVSVSKNNIARGLDAKVLIKEIIGKIGGSGGGRPDFAQAGTKKETKIEEVISDIPHIIGRHLK